MSNPASQVLSRAKALKLPKMGKFGGLMKREFLDHKVGFLWVPCVFAVLLMIGITWAVTWGDSQLQLGDVILGEIHDDPEITINGIEYGMDKINSMELRALKRATGMAMWALSAVVLLVIPFVVIFGLLGSLYEDRRDRSFLFWKSMPVSDTAEVLSKLFAIGVMGPAVIIGISAVVQLYAQIVGGIWGSANGLPVWGFIWHNVPRIELWLGMFAHQVVSMIWALPVLGWLMLVSSYAKRAPLLFAAAPIGATIAFEAMFNQSAYFATWLGTRLSGFSLRFQDGDFEPFVNDGVNMPSPFVGGAWDRLADGFTTFDFWSATALGVALIAATIYSRRYNV